MSFIRFALRLFAVSSVIVLLFSCAKETAQDEPLPEGKYRDVTAYAPQAYPASKVTKATLVGINKYADDSLIFAETKSELHGEKDVYWNSGDYMCAMTANGAHSCWAANKLEETSGEGRFSLENLSYAYAFSMGASSQMSSGYSLSGNVLTITGGFPYTQTLTAGTFGRGNNLVVANAGTTNNWMFYNTGALLCVRITPANGSVTIQDKPYGDFETAYALELENLGTDSYFSGDAQVTINGNSTTSAVSGNGSKRLVLSCPGGYEIKQATDFFFIVPPGTFGTNVPGKGIALTVTLSNGQVYCFLNDHQISLGRNDNYLIASIPLAGAGEEAVLLDSNEKEVGRGTLVAMAAAVTSSTQTVKVLREMFRDDSNFRSVVFQTPCTFDLNGYGFRGNVNLNLGSNTGTMMIKNGCVWNGKDSNKGMIYVTSGAGKVVLDNVKTAALFTGGLDFELNKAVIFGDHIGDSFLALVPEGDSKIDIYAGSAVHFIAQPTGTATVTIHGSYRGESSDANYGPWFMAGNNPTGLNASKYCVTLDGGQILSDGPTGQLGLIEPYRPYPVCTDLSGYTQKFHCCSTKVTGIAIKKDGADVSAFNLEQGNSATLTASITPAGATNQNVHWYSSNTAVATVSGGTVTAVGSGSAVISAYSQDGGYHAECNVTVALNHFVFYVKGANGEMQISRYGWDWWKFPSHSFSTEGNWQNYIEIVQDEPVGKDAQGNYIYETRHYFINPISSFDIGLSSITGISVVTAKSDYGDYTLDFTVPSSTVTGGYIYIYGVISGKGGKLLTQSITSGSEMSIDDSADTRYSVSTNFTAGSQFASVLYNRTSSSAKWKLIQISGEPPAEPQSVTVQPSTLNLTAGNTGNLTATVSPSGAVQAVTWTSANSSIATVDANGQVTAVAAGTTTITATTFGGAHSASCTVTVSPGTVHVTGVSLNKTATTLIVGGSETLTATVIPSNATDKSVTWTSSNTAVATVSGGTVTAKAAGSATITVTTTDGGKKATCAVTVNALTVSITNNKTKSYNISDLRTTQEYTITATTNGSGVNWSISSGNAYASVNGSGKVTPKMSNMTDYGGAFTYTTKIRATSKDDSSVYDEATLTVTKTSTRYTEFDDMSAGGYTDKTSNVTTNSWMKSETYNKISSYSNISTTDMVTGKSGDQVSKRSFYYGDNRNAFDGNVETSFSTNFDIYASDADWNWSLRSTALVDKNYIQIQLPSAAKMLDIYVMSAKYGPYLSSLDSQYGGGVDFYWGVGTSPDWSGANNYSVENSSNGGVNIWKNLYYGENNIKFLRIGPGGGASSWGSLYGSSLSGGGTNWKYVGPFGIAEMKIYKVE